VLQEILKNASSNSPLPIPKELLVGLETSDDAAVYQLNDEQALVATTDFFMPIVDDPYEFGRIAATNALSDVYAMGGKPILALALVAMPVATLDPKTIGLILQGGQDVCHRAGIVVAGGHTIDSVEPIYGLVALGLVNPKQVKKNANAQAGDVLILSKPLGVGVLSAALKKEALSNSSYEQLIAYTTQLNTPGAQLSSMDGVHALTDVTGFGILGHALEMAKGSQLDVHLNWSQLPIIQGVPELIEQGMITGASQRNWNSYSNAIELASTLPAWAQALLTDPQTSGGLLISVASNEATDVLQLLHQAQFTQSCVIGHLQKPMNDQPHVRVA
jgi:selenide,water dikinase